MIILITLILIIFSASAMSSGSFKGKIKRRFKKKVKGVNELIKEHGNNHNSGFKVYMC